MPYLARLPCWQSPFSEAALPRQQGLPLSALIWIAQQGDVSVAERGTFIAKLPFHYSMAKISEMSKPAPPVVGKVTHMSIELYWDEAYTEIIQKLEIKSGRVRVSIQEQDNQKQWGTIYNGYAKKHVVTGLEAKTTYTFRMRFQHGEETSEWSPHVTVTTTAPPLTGEQLHKAIKERDVKAIEKVLESGDVDVDVMDATGFTALMSASQKGLTEIAQFLLERGADVDLKNDSGKTAMMLACFAGQLEVVKILRQFGAKYDIYDKGGSAPIHWAIDSNNVKLIEWMIEDGCDVNMKDEHKGWTPLLRCASVSGNRNTALALMMKGADLNLQDKDGKTALMVAICNAHLPLIELLLQRRADILVKNHFGKTAYDMALSSDKQKIIRVIEEYCEKRRVKIH